MRERNATSAGSNPAPTTRRWLVLAAGLVALCLQVMAQTLTPAAMQNVMQVAAVTAEEAQDFAATCLNTAPRTDGQPAKPVPHESCPVCLTLLQAQGGAAAPIDLVTAIAWTWQPALPAKAILPVPAVAAAAFASRAPPAFS